MLAIALLAVGLFATSGPARADDQAPEPVTAATADSPLELPVSGLIERVKYRALVRPDPDGELDPQDLIASDAGFVPFDPALDEHAPAAWLKLHLKTTSDSNGRYVLRVARRFFQQFDLYIPQSDGTLRRESASVDQSFSAKITGRQFIFNIDVPSGDVTPLLLSVKAFQGSLQPLELWIQDEVGFGREAPQVHLFFGLYFGVFLALIFHNFILYLNLRHRGHLFYVLTMLSMATLSGLDSGIVQNYVLPEQWLPFAHRLNVLFAVLTILTTALFFQVFVQSRNWIPTAHKVINAAIAVFTVLAVLVMVVSTKILLPIALVAQTLILIALFLLLVSSFVAGRRGSTEGYIFCAAWGVFMLGSFGRIFISMDLVGRLSVIEYSMYLGSVLEASILALGLSYRVRQLYERHSEAIREQHKAARLANLDPLTNAYNRRFLENYLVNLLRDKHKRPFAGAVLILDLDDFKIANDDYGHAAGDAILRDLVQRCQQVMRDSDVLCRLGGDEFVIVLNDLGDRKALEVGRRVARAIGDEPFIFENRQIPVTASIGLVSDIPVGCSVNQVLRMADQALYRAKQAGRNQVFSHDPDDTTPFRHGPSLKRPESEQA